MLLVAAAMIVGTLLHANAFAFKSALTESPLPVYSSSSPSPARPVFAPNSETSTPPSATTTNTGAATSPKSATTTNNATVITNQRFRSVAPRPLFIPDREASSASEQGIRWVAPHRDTELWSDPGANATNIGLVHQWGPLQVIGQTASGRLPVWDPSSQTRAWVKATDVGPVDPSLLGTAYLPPIGRPVAWSGAARVTMYTCVELGGCAATASGRWPQPGMVAVDPSLIPLGSTVWIQGLGTFLAADTGSLIKGAHLDVYGLSYPEAVEWGVQERAVLVFPPQ